MRINHGRYIRFGAALPFADAPLSHDNGGSNNSSNCNNSPIGSQGTHKNVWVVYTHSFSNECKRMVEQTNAYFTYYT